MRRVLVTGGVGMIGSAVVRRLLTAGDCQIRVVDQRPAPDWMQRVCDVQTADLRVPENASAAVRGCSHVIHLAAIVGGIGNFHRVPLTLTEVNNALYTAVVRACIDRSVDRYVYVSSSMVFEQATEFPTREDYLPRCPAPHSAYGFSKLMGEVYCHAANREFGLPYTICRPFNAYGPGEVPQDEPGIAHAVPDLIKKVLSGQRPLQIFGTGEQTRTLTYVDDIADGIVTAAFASSGLNEDFNISAPNELTLAEIARLIWVSCGHEPDDFALKQLTSYEVDVQRRWPSVSKAKTMLGWEAQTKLEDGIKRTIAWVRDRLAGDTSSPSFTSAWPTDPA